MKWLRNIADYPSILVSLSFMIGLTVIAWLFPVLNQSNLNDAYHQNRELSKLPPLTKVRFLKVMHNTANPITQGRDPFRYEPFEKYEVIGDRVVLYLNDSFQQVHIADVCYAVSDETLKTLDRQYGGYNFRTMNSQSIRTTQRALIDLIREEHLVTKLFWLGTDQLGRDMLSRILAGAKISLSLAFLALLFTVFFGVAVGLFAGYFGGVVDRVLTWVLGLFWAIPGVLFVVIVALVLENAKAGVVIGITFVMWVEMAQVVKARVKVVRRQEYVRASRLIGLSHLALIRRHVLPNVAAPIFVLAASAFADALMLEAGLSFLGIGISPPNPSWGNMIRTTYGYMLTDNYAYMVLIPALMLFSVVLCAVFLSNGLKDAFELNYNQSTKNKV